MKQYQGQAITMPPMKPPLPSKGHWLPQGVDFADSPDYPKADKPAFILNPHGPPVSGNGSGCLMTAKDQPAGDDAADKKRTRDNWRGLISTAYSHKVDVIVDHIISNLDIQPHRFVPELIDEIADLRAKLAEANQARHVLAGNVERLQGTGQKLAAAEARVAELERELDAANRIAANRTDDAGRYRITADKALRRVVRCGRSTGEKSMISMITCPNCGHDHVMTDDHKTMEQFTMPCREHTCRIVFEVDLEIVAHTRRAPNPGDQRADQKISHGK